MKTLFLCSPARGTPSDSSGSSSDLPPLLLFLLFLLFFLFSISSANMLTILSSGMIYVFRTPFFRISRSFL